MRFDRRVLIVFLVGGCATSNAGKVCSPVASWAAPAYRCLSTAVAAKPEPAPAPTPEPTPEPPAKVALTSETIDLKEKIEFKTDSAEILEQSDTVLDEVVTVMKSHPEIKRIRIDGHTDSQGGHDHNQKLSEARAASVRDYLVKHGIDAGRMTSKGFGPDKPIADNNTDEGRAQNRRVEIHILEKS